MLAAIAGAGLWAATASAAEIEWPPISTQTKPWTRMWWLGNIGTDQDFTSELQKYAQAGLGGIEVTPIYGVKGEEDKFVQYLSPAWVGRFEHILREGKRLGLGVDMATGNGWPFGGPWVTPDIASKEMAFKVFTVRGGGRLGQPVAYLQAAMVRALGPMPAEVDKLKEPTGANPSQQQMGIEQIRYAKPLPLHVLMAHPAGGGGAVDLTARVGADGTLDWAAPAGGDWTLYAIFIGSHGKQVERAGPGGEGEVIDHFNADALKVHLSQFEKAFAGKDIKPRAYFNDSYEVDDASGESSWTPNVFAEFQKRRGYDLRQHLPDLIGNQASDTALRVKTDFRETMSDLLLEQYTQPWAKWAADRGSVIRNQAHGSPANIFDLYAASGIPETEGAGNPVRTKFAASTAHVTGHPLVSSESATWLDGHFVTTLAHVKTAVDSFMLGGVNHIFYHGTAFSPPGEPWPGFQFYASTQFQPVNPWWTDFEALNAYIARCQSVLQGGTPDEEILLYHPMHDAWAQPEGAGRGGAGRGQRGGRGAAAGGAAAAEGAGRRGAVEPSMAAPPAPTLAADGSSGQGLGMLPHFSGPVGAAADLGQVLYRGGFGFDYISDRYVAGLTFSDGALRTGGGTYRTIIVPQARLMPLETMDKLVQLARAGATVIIHDALPTDVPGLGDLEGRRQKFRALAAQLNFQPADANGMQAARVGQGWFLMGQAVDRLLAQVGVMPEAMVARGLNFIRRAYPDGHAYFVVNNGREAITGWVQIGQDDGGSVAVFDPMTGQKGLARTRRPGPGIVEVDLQLLPGDACIVRTYKTQMEGPTLAYWSPAGTAQKLTGEWAVSFVDGGPTLPPAVRTPDLKSWTDFGGDAVKAFSGTATYALTFQRPAGQADAWELDLGTVHETARVRLNGAAVGTLIKPPYRLRITPGMLRPGENTLEVSVSNLMANRIADMDRKGIEFRRFYNANMQRMPSWAGNAPLPSGLVGPVQLTPMRALDPQ
jgi:hypothetical protein